MCPKPAGFGVLFLQKPPRKRHQTRLWMEQGSEKGAGKAAPVMISIASLVAELRRPFLSNMAKTKPKKNGFCSILFPLTDDLPIFQPPFGDFPLPLWKDDQRRCLLKLESSESGLSISIMSQKKWTSCSEMYHVSTY